MCFFLLIFTSRKYSDFNNDTASAHEKFGADGLFENQSFVIFFFYGKDEDWINMWHFKYKVVPYSTILKSGIN